MRLGAHLWGLFTLIWATILDIVLSDIDVVGLRGGNADSRGKTQSMRPLFKIMVPHPGQVVLGPIFTPRNNNNDEDDDDEGMEE